MNLPEHAFCGAMPDARTNIVLIGYRGTGKSAVAREVGRRLSRPWFDADEEVERRAGRSIAELFAEGETLFRDWEERVLVELAARRGIVLATGGGCVLRKNNRDALTRNGFVVWLRARPDTIAARLASDAKTTGQRPALTAQGTLQEVKQVLADRTPIYTALAHATIDTDELSVDAVAVSVLEAWNAYVRAEGR